MQSLITTPAVSMAPEEQVGIDMLVQDLLDNTVLLVRRAGSNRCDANIVPDNKL